MELNNVVWHSDTVSALAGCPKQEIRDLYATIKSSNDEYTRLFKMEMTENFELPSAVVIEWLGECANEGRKRSQFDNSLGVAGTTPVIENTSDSRSSETTEVATEPSAPTTTIDPPSTKPQMEVEEGTTIVPVTSLNPSNTEKDDLESYNGYSTVNNEFILNYESTTQSAETTTVAKNFEFSEIGVEGEQETTSPSSSSPTTNKMTEPDTFDSLFIQNNTIPDTITSMSPLEQEEERKEVETTTTLTTQASVDITTLSALPEESNVKREDDVDDGGPHYGKYIGLGAAFLIFVAYLVCSRSYKRQGMYELHNE